MPLPPEQAEPAPLQPRFPPMHVSPAVDEPPLEKSSWVVPIAQGTKRQIRASELLALQRRHRNALKSCYELALTRDPELTEVTLQLTVMIEATGAVKEVKVQPSGPLSSCIARSVRRWVFPAVGEQTLGFPIIFRG